MARPRARVSDPEPEDDKTTEPSPPPDPDKDVRRGGPGDEPAAEPTEPKEPDQPAARGTRVKIGRGEYEVHADVAAALEERERDYMRGIQMDRRERDELDRYRRAAQPTPPAEAPPNFDTLLFENPTKALELRDKAIEQRIEARYRAAQSTEQMWTKFFRDHPDLDDERVLVNAQFQADFDSIADLPAAKAMDVLADNVRKEILRISRKAKGTGTVTPLTTGRATVEGATGDRSAPPRKTDDDDKPWSLSQEIKANRARRRAARQGA